MGRISPTFWRNKLGSGMMWKTRSLQRRLKKHFTVPVALLGLFQSFVPIVTLNCHQEGGVVQRVAITRVIGVNSEAGKKWERMAVKLAKIKVSPSLKLLHAFHIKMILEIDDTGCFIMESCLCQTQISFYSFPFATSQRRLMLTKWCKWVKHLGNYWRAGFSGDSHVPQAWPCWLVNTIGPLAARYPLDQVVGTRTELNWEEILDAARFQIQNLKWMGKHLLLSVNPIRFHAESG